MDFIEWCHVILDKIAYINQAETQSWYAGISLDRVAKEFFNKDLHMLATVPQGHAIVDAVTGLERINLIAKKKNNLRSYELTRLGKEAALDPIPLWEGLCTIILTDEEEQVLRVVGKLSEHTLADCAQTQEVPLSTLLSEIG